MLVLLALGEQLFEVLTRGRTGNVREEAQQQQIMACRKQTTGHRVTFSPQEEVGIIIKCGYSSYHMGFFLCFSP